MRGEDRNAGKTVVHANQVIGQIETAVCLNHDRIREQQSGCKFAKLCTEVEVQTASS